MRLRACLHCYTSTFLLPKDLISYSLTNTKCCAAIYSSQIASIIKWETHPRLSTFDLRNRFAAFCRIRKFDLENTHRTSWIKVFLQIGYRQHSFRNIQTRDWSDNTRWYSGWVDFYFARLRDRFLFFQERRHVTLLVGKELYLSLRKFLEHGKSPKNFNIKTPDFTLPKWLYMTSSTRT